ncbi:MAG: hypothetical protein WBX01_09105 [Nitrososphaeraceae archaeon]
MLISSVCVCHMCVSYETTRESLEVTEESSSFLAQKELDNEIECPIEDRYFVDIFSVLAGDEMYDVKKENLIDELVNTGKFTEEEVPKYIKKAQQNGFIFERKVDMYACMP